MSTESASINKIGIMGHRVIPPRAFAYVERGIDECLDNQHGNIVGYSCLTAGAAQVFAQSVLDHGGQLVVIIPCRGYETTFTPANRVKYQRLLSQATTATTLDYPGPSSEAYRAAGHAIVDAADVLIAVWDGHSLPEQSVTADVVAYARSVDEPVAVVWPAGTKR